MNHTKTKVILKPGQPGTMRLKRIYGDDLICVRYKYDYKHRKRYKTVELLVEEKPWAPKKSDPFSKKNVFVKITYGEADLAKEVRDGGGVWEKELKLWKVPLQTVLDLNIEYRIIPRH